MELRNNWYKADKGKHFVLTEKGKKECAGYRNKTVGKPVDEYDYETTKWSVDKGYVVETDIPRWTKGLKGYEVVYYNGKYRLSAGSPQIFPTRKAAEVYKKHYESYPWFDEELLIEETEYDGVPLSESKMYNGKEIVDKEHYFGLDAHEVGEYFTEDMIDFFMDLLPPICMRNDCSQIGEPCSSRDLCTAWELVIHKRTTMGSMELKIKLHYMLIYAIIKLLKVINIKSHENCSWLFFCAKRRKISNVI